MSERIKTILEGLYRVPEDAKAEIVDGELILMAPMGGIATFPDSSSLSFGIQDPRRLGA